MLHFVQEVVEDMTRYSNPKSMFNEVLKLAYSYYPEVEIRDFDYAKLDRASFLIRNIAKKLSDIYGPRSYSFDYYFVFKLNFSKEFLTAHVSAYGGKKINTYIVGWVIKTKHPVIRPEEHSLFIWVYDRVLRSIYKCYDCEEVKKVFKEVADRENLKFIIEQDPRANNSIVYALELPVEANVLEYNAI